jgi:hypothetical protein
MHPYRNAMRAAPVSTGGFDRWLLIAATVSVGSMAGLLALAIRAIWAGHC